MLRAVLDVVFPPRCAACRRPGDLFCEGCWPGVCRLGPPGCRRCGRPFARQVERCPDCPPSPLAWCRSPFRYEGPVRRGLMQLKFSGRRTLPAALAPWMLEALLDDPPPGRRPGAVVTWVPLGPRRRRSRGYDQARMLATEVAALAGWPAIPLLARAVETAPQALRAGAARAAAMRGAFVSVRPPPPVVVLVDDVLTTGATVAACARVLMAAGAAEVGVLTAARSLGGPLPARCYTPLGLQSGSVVARGVDLR